MSEEEIIKRINFLIMRLVEERKQNKLTIGDIRLQEALQSLLDLYQKEKEKNKELENTLKQTQDSWYEDTQTIEALRNKNAELRDKLDEKNAELNKRKKMYQELCAFYSKDYIAKSKIKAKIDEINNECKKCRFKGEICETLNKNNQCVQGIMKQYLQELLEEEG